MRKLIVISAPSGAGKTSIIHFLLKNIQNLSFSISACSRDKRENEHEGKDYYFLGIEEFQRKISEDAFLEWEEVYKDQYYGTLKTEVEKIWAKGKTVIFDLDVVGGINIKNKYPNECLSIFIMPPSINTLKERLKNRQSESLESLELRLSKVKQEIARSREFDKVIVNDDLELACRQIKQLIEEYII